MSAAVPRHSAPQLGFLVLSRRFKVKEMCGNAIIYKWNHIQKGWEL